jgi:hypothetical protein
MSTYVITKHVVLTLSVEADSEEEAEQYASESRTDEWEYVDMTAQWIEKVDE